MSRFTQGALSALCGAALWGFSGACAQYLFAHYAISPLFITVTRMLAAGTLFLLLLIARYRERLAAILRDPPSLRRLAVFGGVGLLGSQLTYVIAVAYTNAGTATVLQCLSIVVVMLATCIIMHRLPRAGELVALLCALGATVLIATKGDLGVLNLPLAGLMWGLANAVATAFYIMYPRRLFDAWGSLATTGLGMLAGGIAMLFVWLAVSILAPVVSPAAIELVTFPSLDATGVLVLTLFVFVGTFCAFGLYLHGVSIVGGVAGGLLGAIEPVSATMFSAIWLSTAFTGADWMGLVLMLVTIALVTLGKREQPRPEAPANRQARE